MKDRRSLAIYLALIAYLAAAKVALDLGSVEVILPGQATAFSWPVIGFLAVVGGFSVWAGPRAGCPTCGTPRIRRADG